MGLTLFCGDTFKFKLSKRRVGGVGGMVRGLEGILWCFGFGILWDDVDGDLFSDRISWDLFSAKGRSNLLKSWSISSISL